MSGCSKADLQIYVKNLIYLNFVFHFVCGVGNPIKMMRIHGLNSVMDPHDNYNTNKHGADWLHHKLTTALHFILYPFAAFGKRSGDIYVFNAINENYYINIDLRSPKSFRNFKNLNSHLGADRLNSYAISRQYYDSRTDRNQSGTDRLVAEYIYFLEMYSLFQSIQNRIGAEKRKRRTPASIRNIRRKARRRRNLKSIINPHVNHTVPKVICEYKPVPVYIPGFGDYVVLLPHLKVV